MTDRNDRHERLREGSRFLTEAIEHYRQRRYPEATAAAEIAAAIFAHVASEHSVTCRVDPEVVHRGAQLARAQIKTAATEGDRDAR